MNIKSLGKNLLFIGLLLAGSCHAAISLNLTRIIFSGGKHEASVTVKNQGDDILVQSWLESSTSANAPLPFAITPALVRLNAQSQQLLRILYQGTGMPQDRESMIWLNVQEIPKKSKNSNTLQIAIRQKIKIFYRPQGLPGSATQAPEMLIWQFTPAKGSVTVTNPSAYYVNMVDIKRQHAGARADKDILMLAPQESRHFVLNAATISPGVLTFGVINDFGGRDLYSVNIQSNEIKKMPSQ